MRRDGHDFLDALAEFPPRTFESNFSKISRRLGLGRLLSGTELNSLYQAAAILVTLVIFSADSPASGNLKLPVGNGVPAIALGERHGLILASDGSLWSWGSDFLGWPVLGQTNSTKHATLYRIGDDTNWL